MAEWTLERLLQEARYYEALADKPMPLAEQAIWRTLANNYRLRAVCLHLSID